MRIAMFGSSGFLGSALAENLRGSGHVLRRFVRISPNYIEEPDKISWDPYEGSLPERYLEGCEAVINLCGVSIASSRWTADFKRQMTDSRVITTEVIARKLAGMPNPPQILLNASAVGYYGHRDIGQRLTEASPSGHGFLAEMCRKWEGATSIAEWAGMRVVHMRFGLVLGQDDGVMARLIPIFRANLGGRLGHGLQPMSWIALPDMVAAVEFLLNAPAIDKAVNITSPEPVTNVEFTRELSSALGKKAVLAVPGIALELAYGEMARESVLSGQAVIPRKLINAGFSFRYPKLAGALQYAVKRVA